MRTAVCLLLCVGASLAAGQTGSPAVDRSGVLPEWDVRANMAAMAADIGKLAPLFEQVLPADWISKGAPEVYVRQLQSCQASMRGVVEAAGKLSREPEKMSIALDAFFQMERMELLINSLRDGIRRYQSPDLADTVSRAFAENMVHRDRLRQHIRDLAKTREQEFEIVNQEAQRCRGQALHQPPAPKKPPTRKKQ